MYRCERTQSLQDVPALLDVLSGVDEADARLTVRAAVQSCLHHWPELYLNSCTHPKGQKTDNRSTNKSLILTKISCGI